MNKHMELYYTNIKHQCMKSCKTKQIHNKFIEQKTKFETKHYKSLKFMAKVGQAKKTAKSCPGVVPELSRSCPGVVPELSRSCPGRVPGGSRPKKNQLTNFHIKKIRIAHKISDCLFFKRICSKSNESQQFCEQSACDQLFIGITGITRDHIGITGDS